MLPIPHQHAAFQEATRYSSAKPKQELLDLIEECGAEVVDDDLYHGRRYITKDVREDLDPIDALTEWYFDRNVNVPCPTRVQHDADWDTYLSNVVDASGADPGQWLAGADRQQGSWWEAWADWVTARSGVRQPQPENLGSERHPVLGPAPGLYVRDMVPT